MDQQEKLKQIPLILMLSAAALTAIISLFSEISFGVFLLRVFISSISFYLIGLVVQILFAYALKKEEEKKEPSEEDQEDESTDTDEGSEDVDDDYEDE